MEIKDLATLKKLISLCQKEGVQIIKVDGIELVLSEKSKPQKQYRAPKVSETFIPGGITENTKIVTEELTPEQLLMWSSAPGGHEEQIS